MAGKANVFLPFVLGDYACHLNLMTLAVEPSISFDVLADYEGTSHAIKAISIPTKINKIELVEGNMPSADNECLVDSYLFDSSSIGNMVTISNCI